MSMYTHSLNVIHQSNNELIPLKTVSTLNDLIKTIRIIFNQEEINVNEIHKILNDFECDFTEWQKYIYFNKTHYTRNLIDEGNGRYNLFLLCWSEDQGTRIHDHSGAHCFVKLIKGCIEETIFEWPKYFTDEKSNYSINQIDLPLTVKSVSEMRPGDVTYMHDKIGIHRLHNPSTTETAITLHLYFPPYTNSMIFEESTSRMKKMDVTFHSKFGKQIPQ
ncbi:Cysteine dioxygenase [Schistosoma japonicum]|uniref:Cysteine dioxygenase n=1 Tax=Schistosoma japonicum TaxID=6182 RepID=A0A4Z2D1C9_SCHJA|nr:Cysteine dioxygenase [Schistosoma japonicum]